jgi:hypothetical protein
MMRRDEDEHGDCWVFSIFSFLFFPSVSYNQSTNLVYIQASHQLFPSYYLTLIA